MNTRTGEPQNDYWQLHNLAVREAANLQNALAFIHVSAAMTINYGLMLDFLDANGMAQQYADWQAIRTMRTSRWIHAGDDAALAHHDAQFGAAVNFYTHAYAIEVTP